MASIVSRLLPSREGEHRISTDGVTATVEDGCAKISISLVTRWGRNCSDVAEQVQDQVAEEVRSYTGLPATVSITITDVECTGRRAGVQVGRSLSDSRRPGLRR